MLVKLKLLWMYAKGPEEIEFETKKTALVIIDMQNDFCSNEGMLGHMGVDISRFLAPVKPIKRVAAASRKAGIKVICVYTAFRPDLSDATKEFLSLHERTHVQIGQKIGPPGKKLGVLIRGTWNTEYVEELEPQVGDILVEKKTYGAFQDTDLGLILRNLGIDTLVFTGVGTHMCVETTLRQGFMRGFRVILLRDCTGTLDEELQRLSERIAEFWFGYVTSSDEFVKSLEVK